MNNQILRTIIMLSTQITLQNTLRTITISLLRIERGARHVRNHGVSASEGVLGIAERMVFWCGLREPDVAAVAAEVTGFESCCNILFYNDGAAGGVYEPGSWISVLIDGTERARSQKRGRRGHTRLHLSNQLLVEQTASLLMQRTVNSNDITLGDQFLQGINTSATNLLLDFGLQRLVVEIQQLLTIKWLQSPQYTLTNSSYSNSSYNLALEIKLILCGGSDVPFTSLDLFMRGDEVTDEDEDGHDDVFGDGDDIGAGYFGDGDTAVGLVGCVQVDVVGADTSGNGNLELLGFCETLGSEVAGVETVQIYMLAVEEELKWGRGGKQEGAYGVVMIISASTSSLSKVEFSPSLSEVVTRVCP
jgi:hypothetical protein